MGTESASRDGPPPGSRPPTFRKTGDAPGPPMSVLPTPYANGHAPPCAGRASPLRVCHLGKYYPPATGGMEAHVRTLAQGQAALGADVRVICVNHADPAGRDVTWRRCARTRSVEERDGSVRVLRVGR